ncbi:MAG TPA: divalent-cation tolerance protein CutA [Micromonosporaceae bacterium]
MTDDGTAMHVTPGNVTIEPECAGGAVEQTYLQVTTTIDEQTAARDLARSAVTARLAACAQVAARVRSVYWWDGKVTEADEWTVTFKTTGARYPALEEHIRASHSYEIPEIVATAIAGGDPAYLAWIGTETNSV